MSDSIVYRKDDVFNALVEKGQASRRYKLGEELELNFKEIREALENVPSAEEERKIGKWICEPHPNWSKWGIYIVKCSECEFSDGAWKWNYCPNCGSKMERSKYIIPIAHKRIERSRKSD